MKLIYSGKQRRSELEVTPSVPQQICFSGIPWGSSVLETSKTLDWNFTYEFIHAERSKNLLNRFKEVYKSVMYSDDEFGNVTPKQKQKETVVYPGTYGMQLMVTKDFTLSTMKIPEMREIGMFNYVLLQKDGVLTYDFADTALTSIYFEGISSSSGGKVSMLLMLSDLTKAYGKPEEEDVTEYSLNSSSGMKLYRWTGSNNVVCQLIIDQEKYSDRCSYKLTYAWMNDDKLIDDAKEASLKSIANYYHKIQKNIL